MEVLQLLTSFGLVWMGPTSMNRSNVGSDAEIRALAVGALNGAGCLWRCCGGALLPQARPRDQQACDGRNSNGAALIYQNALFTKYFICLTFLILIDHKLTPN